MLSQERNWLKYLLPKEHGAWAMWVVPFVIATAAAGRITANTLLMFDAVLLVFLSRSAFSSAIRLRRRDQSAARKCGFTAILLVFVATPCLIPVLRETDGTLWVIIALGGLLFVLDLIWVQKRTERHLLAELAGVAGFALSAPAAFVATSGVGGPEAWVLWLVSFGFFSGSVFYVKLLVARMAGGSHPKRRFSVQNYSGLSLGYALAVASLAVILSLAGWTPRWMILAFVPWLVHVLWALSHTTQRSIHGVGWTLVAHSLYFTIFTSLSFALG
jgi:hypothetical protein